MDILHLAAPYRNVPVTFTLNMYGLAMLPNVFLIASSLIFLLLGPLIGGISAVMYGDGPYLLFALMVGVAFAFLAWAIYCTIFFSILKVANYSGINDGSSTNSAILFGGAFIGAVSGAISVGVPSCAMAGWLFDGYVSCLAVIWTRYWAIGFLPGLICGGLSSFFLLAEHKYPPDFGDRI